MSLGLALKEKALALGFDLVGIAPLVALKDMQFCREWLEKGYGGGMHYLANPKRDDPRLVLPSAKSILCVGLIYNTPHPYSTDVGGCSVDGQNPPVHMAATPGVASRVWISRYAWGKDYHEVMRTKLERLRTIVEHVATGVETRVYVDTGPIVERAFARLSGIGWMGKNTCLINERMGSWFFLGVILTNLELELDLPASDRCGSCTRCLEACPTGALAEPYVMDASRCISYFNIELKGAIPEEFRTAIGRNIFGCDICQDVCPWNSRLLSVVSGQLPGDVARGKQSDTVTPQRCAAVTNLAEFQPMQVEVTSREPLAEQTAENVAVPQISNTEEFSLFNPPLGALASVTEEDFHRIFARSPIKRAKYRGWLRNLCVVMGNSGDRQFIPWLEAAAGHSDPVVREHAAWALRRLHGGV